MKVSDIIKDLKNDIRWNGDSYVKDFKITTETETIQRYMVSPTRKKKNGMKALMSLKEFREWLKIEKN